RAAIAVLPARLVASAAERRDPAALGDRGAAAVLGAAGVVLVAGAFPVAAHRAVAVLLDIVHLLQEWTDVGHRDQVVLERRIGAGVEEPARPARHLVEHLRLWRGGDKAPGA